MSTKSATVQLTQGMAFRATADSGQQIVLDASADVDGTGQGPTPMELLLMALERPARKWLTRLISVVCIAICFTMAWYGFEVTVLDWVQNNKDVRSFDAPRWAIVMWIPISFLFMGLEFVRYLWRDESPLAALASESGGGSH